MAWRNQGSTGSNNIPLGARRRFGDPAGSAPSDDDGGYKTSQPRAGQDDSSYKRGRSPPPAAKAEFIDDRGRKRKKRNRWGDAQENKAAGLMGLATAITTKMTSEQLEAYTLHLRIEEISQKLRINDVVPADGDRSPSPAPQYDNKGHRVNTREFRYRKRLEEERHKLIEKAMKTIPNYHPPSDYRRPTKTSEKVYVPVNDYPEINFIGLLIGPRGNTLKKMETESLAKIAIRGKGSVKEGKGRSDAAHTSNQEEDLHCLIMADTEDKINKAKELIHNVIETAASIPEGQNELKRNQLRELAALNGTLRDDENQACQNCGQIGHRKYDCPEQRNFTSGIICRVCGNAGHMAKDCPDRARGSEWRNAGPGAGEHGAPAVGGGDAVDREYAQLMQELEGGGPVGNGQGAHRIEAGPGGYDNAGPDARGGAGDRALKPWERGPTGAPAPWANRGRDDYNSRDNGGGGGGGGGPPPWQGASRGGDGYGYGQQSGGYGAPQGQGQAHTGGAAPWQQQQQQQPQSAAPGAQQGYGGYSGYPGSGYPAQQGIGAPPGLPSMYQGYPGAAGSPPPPPPPSGAAPPPPPGAAPPPPPSDQPPPPPPSRA